MFSTEGVSLSTRENSQMPQCHGPLTLRSTVIPPHRAFGLLPAIVPLTGHPVLLRLLWFDLALELWKFLPTSGWNLSLQNPVVLGTLKPTRTRELGSGQPFHSKREDTRELVSDEILHGFLCTVMANSALWKAWCLLGRSKP